MINKFISNENIKDVVSKYGSPLYVYDEKAIVNNINKLKSLSTLKNFKVNYAVKANSNLEILKLVKECGLKVDATGYGEVYLNQQAGFNNENIYVVGNNFTKEEIKRIVDEGIVISLDAIDQIRFLGEVAYGYDKVMLRMNPTFGAGANASVVTGGKKTKFGIDYDKFLEAKAVMAEYNLKLIGINQHIGSAYLEHESLLKGVKTILDFVVDNDLDDLEIINFGGGFGLNYERNHNDLGMDFDVLTKELNAMFEDFLKGYNNKDVSLEFEPGRFIVASSAVLIGEVTSVKDRGDVTFIGTNLGFTNMIRPTLYDSYHEVEVITSNDDLVLANVVGNICESGDYMCKQRELLRPNLEDLVVVYDVGAYGFSMASNYNARLRPAEVMIKADGSIVVIRKRQTYEELIRN